MWGKVVITGVLLAAFQVMIFAYIWNWEASTVEDQFKVVRCWKATIEESIVNLLK
jgi:hypothetical protein